MSLEDQIKSLARFVADETWGTGNQTMYGSITIRRLEQTGPDDWQAFYQEPDTGTEAFVSIMRQDDTLYAYDGAEIVAEAEIEDPAKTFMHINVKAAVIDWQAGKLEITAREGGAHSVALDAPIRVVMVGWPEPGQDAPVETKDMQARDLGDYMRRGYIIQKIRFEEDQG